MKSKFYLVGSTAHSLINFRYDLLKSLKKKYEVVALSQDFDPKVKKKLKSINVKYESYGSSKIIFFHEFFSFINLARLFYSKNIKIISFTLRANVFVGLANIIFKKKLLHFPMITGLGGIFLSKNENDYRYLLYKVFKIILKISLKNSVKIIFQNKSDQKFFLKEIIKKKSAVIPGSGVNTNYYKYSKPPKTICFLMISRIIKNKGIINYFKLSKILSKKYPNIKFLFVGKEQKNFSLNINLDKGYLKKHNIQFIDWKNDVRSIFDKCSVYVLPSKREGFSRSILEAMSSGKPIITTNVPGCKEAVINNFNGYLVGYNDLNGLIKSAEKFIKRPSIIKKLGINSRKRVIKNFNSEIINKKILETIKL